MSDSTPTQWISQYLQHVAEIRGDRVTDASIDGALPGHRKKVQILNFLTFNQQAAIWGQVSDGEYTIPVCFTKEAVTQYAKDFQGHRLTETNNAIVCIGRFRPIFVPIPVGNNRMRFSKEPCIALEAGYVEVLHSGSDAVGSTKDIEMNAQTPTHQAWDVLTHNRLVCKRDTQHPTDSYAAKTACSYVGSAKAPLAPQEPVGKFSQMILELGVRRPDCIVEYDKREAPFHKDAGDSHASQLHIEETIAPASAQASKNPTPLQFITVMIKANADQVDPEFSADHTIEAASAETVVSFAQTSRHSGNHCSDAGEDHRSLTNMHFNRNLDNQNEQPLYTNHNVHQDRRPSTAEHLVMTNVIPPAMYITESEDPPDEVDKLTSRVDTMQKQRSTMHSLMSSCLNASVPPSGLIPSAIPRAASPLQIDTPSNNQSDQARARNTLSSMESGFDTRNDTEVYVQKSSERMSFLGKKHRRRLMGYQVDFENIVSGGPSMSMGRLQSILLRTGRVRTLGDEVTKDGRIFMRPA
ncbi:hypothetical protein BDR06DRAFT_976402 [Suillus hirtellus]|nr:hypothetical protein BDR06DRAFT_976402 [Suillus hirtellus]